MNNIKAIQLFFQGKKTYIVTSLAALYVAGSYLNWWTFNIQILALFGFSSVAALGAKIERLLSDNSDTQTKPGGTVTILILCAMLFSFPAQSQTNNFSDGFKIMANSLTSGTNWDFDFGYGHSSKGKNNLAFSDVAYNFTDNVGLIIGYDALWTKGESQFNSIKGGLTLQTEIYPLKFTGISWLENIKGKPFVADLISTPRNGNQLGNILSTGINFDVLDFSRFNLDIGSFYENRSGQGRWDGNYLAGYFGISRRW